MPPVSCLYSAMRMSNGHDLAHLPEMHLPLKVHNPLPPTFTTNCSQLTHPYIPLQTIHSTAGSCARLGVRSPHGNHIHSTAGLGIPLVGPIWPHVWILKPFSDNTYTTGCSVPNLNPTYTTGCSIPNLNPTYTTGCSVPNLNPTYTTGCSVPNLNP